jgi:2-polyprenyl-6-methoxyphenol hydroxylase-like FAD-dependent oxidoreductase
MASGVCRPYRRCCPCYDAYVLAACLAKAPSITEAFSKYQAKRMSRAKRVVSTSYQLAQLTNLKGSLAIGIRNFIIKKMPNLISQKQFDFLYGVNLDI